MNIRSAASTARALVITHLVMGILLGGFNIVRTFGYAFGGGVQNLTFLLTSVLYLAATIILDAAILLVLGSLSRTKEQLLHDSPGTWNDDQYSNDSEYSQY